MALTGIGYGLALGVAMTIIVFTGTWIIDAIGQSQTASDPTGQNLILPFLMLAAVLSLFIAAGLAPARRMGSVLSGLLAGVIVAAALDVTAAVVMMQESPWTSFTQNVSDGIVPSLIGLVVSAIFALIGRWAYYRSLRKGALVGSGAV